MGRKQKRSRPERVSSSSSASPSKKLVVRPNDQDRSEPAPKGFFFVDRSGKVHGHKPKPGQGVSPMPREEKPHRFEKPKTKFQRPDPFSKIENRKKEHDREISRKARDRFDRKKTERKEIIRGAPKVRKAVIDKNKKGFGFMVFEDRRGEDAFLPPRLAERFFHGDRVEVAFDTYGEIEDVKVLQHRFRELVGRFSPHPAGSDRGGWVVYERKKAREEVFVPEAHPELKAGDWVRATLEFHEDGPFAVTAKIVEVYGADLPPSADIGMVAAEYNLIEEHSKAAEVEARTFTIEVPGKDLQGREDLREIPFITIDGETARDFDDAVYVERSKNGYVLWVAIADVSHYVASGTALDTEAFSRGTSVYFPERAFHMLPRTLSENLCSLKPNEPRLALTARIELDRSGDRTSTRIMESVIFSRRRATYNQIQDEWEANQKNKNWEFTPHFELFKILKDMRMERGTIDFDFPESEMKVKPTGEVESIEMRARKDAHRLIEEFMICANEAVTEWALEKGFPFLYRIHEEPSIRSLERFQDLAATLGVKFNIDGGADPKEISALVKQFEGHPAQEMLNLSLLRSMKQAVYSSIHHGHYGLASEAYTHFTSPIRRYPDLAVHRQLRRAMRIENKREQALSETERAAMEETLANVSEHCSYRERLASDAEREANKLKQVRLAATILGREYEGRVIGLSEAGMFTQLQSPYIEGMIPKESMADDTYEFNEDRMVFLGRRKKRTYQIGNKLPVKVLRADIEKRVVELGRVEDVGLPPIKPRPDGKSRRDSKGRRGQSEKKLSRREERQRLRDERRQLRKKERRSAKAKKGH